MPKANTSVIKPIYSRIGGKTKLVKTILPMIPKHRIYTEAFFGGGAIFWNKPTAEYSAINDLDHDIYSLVKLIRDGNINIQDNEKLKKISLEQANKYVKINDDLFINDTQLFVKKMLIRTCTFTSSGKGKIYRTRDFDRVIKRLPFYKNKLQNTEIYNSDYEKVLKLNDEPDAFHFIDPPYEESKNLYTHGDFDIEHLEKVARELCGNVMITLNDSPTIRKIFKDWIITDVIVKKSASYGIASKDRKELIITNY